MGEYLVVRYTTADGAVGRIIWDLWQHGMPRAMLACQNSVLLRPDVTDWTVYTTLLDA